MIFDLITLLLPPSLSSNLTVPSTFYITSLQLRHALYCYESSLCRSSIYSCFLVFFPTWINPTTWSSTPIWTNGEHNTTTQIGATSKNGGNSPLHCLAILLYTGSQPFCIFSVPIQNTYFSPQLPNMTTISYLLADGLASTSQKNKEYFEY